MKKIINFRRFLTALVCCCLLITGFSFGASATENEEELTINHGRKGTLTLEKFENTADGTIDDRGGPVSGAEFTAYKLAFFSSEGVESLIKNKTIDADTVLDSDLIASVNNNIDLFKKYVSTETSPGVYTFGDMDLGIYLVVETDSPTNYYATTDSFLVSIPRTNNEGTAWEYDVVAYPKNNSINVDKSVTEIGTKADSYSIGDTVPFIIQSTIPKYSKNSYILPIGLQFYFTDTMSKGLTFLPSSVKVTVGEKLLTIGKDYKVDSVTNKDGITTIKIELTKNAIIAYKGQDIKVEYSATLNEHARITYGENNCVTLTFTSNPQTGDKNITEEKKTKVYTYQMDVEKKFEGKLPDNTDLSKVKFTLKDSEGKSLYAKKVNDVWIINTSITSETSGYTTALHLNGHGNLIIKGLDAGEYTLTEVSTLPGYNLLKDPIKIAVEETKDNNGVVTGVVKAKVDRVKAHSEGGYFDFKVINTKGFELPQTGGMGTWMYTLGGLLLMAASAVVMLSMRKKRAVK